MDIQACVQLVNEYRPDEEVPPVLHEAVTRLTAALADPTPLADGLRPLVKALATAAPHLPERWNDILHALRGVLESHKVPWLHRAFVLKTLPAMLVDVPTAQQKEYGEALCELLVHWSVVSPSSTSNTESCGVEDAQDESTERPNPQERRVALTALLTLPQEYAASIVQQLIAKLPQSVTTCTALLSNPSANEELKKEFEDWLCSQSASSQASCAAEVEKKLKEYFPGYGAAKCKHCCDSLISRERLKSMDDLNAFQADLRALEDVDAAHRSIIKTRLSLAFLLMRATEVVNLVYSHQGEQQQHSHLTINLEESVLPLSVLRSIVQLTDFASVTPDSVNTPEIRSLAASLLIIDSADAALDAPLPLVECVFHILLRSLPCVPASDEGMRSLLQDIIRVSEILLPVMDNAVLKIQSAIPLLHEQRQQKSNGKTNTEVVAEEDQEQFKQSLEARRQSALSALRVAQTMAHLCSICKKKCLIQTEQQRQEEVENEKEKEEKERLHLKMIAEGLASGARGVALSWTKERERMLRLDVTSRPQVRQLVTSTTGNRREMYQHQHQHQRPHYPRQGDKNVNHRPPKRRRRDVNLM
ncbi:uncharacterized protein TM35_000013820 [Trypanosoma theileri]|uniref:Uncharacterized protein n=1 Tax=Trypanosoma theileri TaxID=67003 RepID=A0A1X0P9J5_9TRYP|nr:uncharacterized protein TM35_000013820 [Trypanosoma theileri]ORC93505.1 hypothetical protein TM35_000013820 [Trypanosoma theileri]